MTGNTLTEFMDDLLAMDGPEKEFVFRGNDTLWKHSLMKKILHKRNL